MAGGLLVVAGVLTNYLMHRLGLQTICQWIREHVPKPLAAILAAGGFSWFLPHLLNGYPADRWWVRAVPKDPSRGWPRRTGSAGRRAGTERRCPAP